LWELDILWHSIRKLRIYEEIHTVFTRYLGCDGVYRFLSAGGNDRYGRTRSRTNRVYESSFAATNALAQQERLDFGLCEKVRAAEKLTAFLELESAIQGSAFAIDKQTRLFAG
jgi:hypothetical protein